MAKKKTRVLLDKIREAGFEFHVYEKETDVYYRRRLIGSIIGLKEASGRHCFRLGFDQRREPRTYRGRVKAAEALAIIDDLKRRAKKGRWSVEDLISRSWDAKPHASPK